ncbi:hypothetical protein [Corallococcus macrosporus]|uniref:Transcriptional regulator n=1 Tax=Corallococcus macrosporus DSM 14697 TaxID=1189310 RepID=A0A250K4Q5_9BACT|nr:hypothetical protein [Corallococcus macrosporus]ATB51064.1 hypothetical protein MYMAC_006721 [Corallococcus macrosporus DSM 14697]
MTRLQLVVVLLLVCPLLGAAPVVPKKGAPVSPPVPAVRFELYRAVDRGDPKAGSDVHIGADGKRYGMGREDYRPFIERCELVPPAGVDPLALELVFLPYFREQKPSTTLAAYFKAQAVGASKLRELLPRDLTGYLRSPAEERRFFSTLIEPETQPTSVLVVWNGDTQWYVDNVFYHLERADGWTRRDCTDVVEGSLQDFLRHSPLIQPRLNEGLSGLSHPERPERFSAKDIVLTLQKTPGMPGTRDFWLEVHADGRFMFSRTVRGTDAHRLTTLLIAARRLRVSDNGRQAARPPAHDEQVTTLSWQVDGRRTQVTLGRDTPYSVMQFARQMAAAYGIEL